MAAQSMDSDTELWEEVADRLNGDFKARRVLILLEENPDEDFQLAAGRGLDETLPWEDQVDFDLLVDTYEHKAAKRSETPFPAICALLREPGKILGLLYVDRERTRFSNTELTNLATLGEEVTQWMETLNSPLPQVMSQSPAPPRSSNSDLALDALNSKVVFLLLANGLISGAVAQDVLKEAESRAERADRLLVENYDVDEAAIAQALAEHHDLEYVEIEEDQLSREALSLLTPSVAAALNVIPLEADSKALRVATASLAFEKIQVELSTLTGRKVQIALARRSVLEALLGRYADLARPKPERKEPDLERQRQLETQAAASGDQGRFQAQATNFSATSRNGIVGGRYRLGDEIMTCRFSTLYRAHDRSRGIPAILRKLELPPSSQNRYWEARLQTLREGRVLSRLTHPNLPRVQEIIEDGEEMYLVLEELTGDTLQVFREQYEGDIPAELVRRLMNQFLSVLEYLHSQEPAIIHRDLRPETILITPHGSLKIAEFGLAKMGEAEDAGTSAGKTAFRSQGSPNFASPEQLLGEPSHPGNDLYSVGALLYFLATGSAPPPSTQRCLDEDTLQPLAEARSDFPENLCRAIHQLLEPQAESRPNSVQQVHELLVEEVELFEEKLTVPQSIVVEDVYRFPEPGSGKPVIEVPEALVAATNGEQQTNLVVKSFAKQLSTWQVMFGERAHPEAGDLRLDFKMEYREAFGFEDIAECPIRRETGRLLPETLCKAAGAVCLERINDNALRVAVKEPRVNLADDIFIATKGAYRAELVRADGELVEQAIEYVFDSDHLAQGTTWTQFLAQRRQPKQEDLELTSSTVSGLDDEDSVVVETVNRVIKDAIAVEATDIHLEPFDQLMNLRYRVDGLLCEVDTFEPEAAGAIVRRVKLMANLDPNRRGTPQGGRISLRVGSSDFDLRVSILPVPDGESCVLKVFKKGSFNFRLADLGFEPEMETRYRKLLSQRHGLLLLCGPVSAGKATTLYASIKETQRPERKLITAEDPIKYRMPGITQVQVDTTSREEDTRLTFADTLREALRHDPDVIMVSELRDPETASVAIQAASAGHLVLSTVPTRDTLGVVTRLKEMGTEPFMVGSTLLGALSQRLARKICTCCRQEVHIPKSALKHFEEAGVREPKMFLGTGCPECNHTGYQGRVAIYELLEVQPELRTLINASVPRKELQQAATEAGFEPLVWDGLRKVARGIVTLEEVERVCKG